MSERTFNLEDIQGELIVSCQALPEEPLHSSFIMGRMALAAQMGGAKGIRANTPEDITEIRKNVDLPIIAIIKRVYDDSDVYITPTLREVQELMAVDPEIIACDATRRAHPDGQSLEDFFRELRANYPEQLFMADCSSYEDAMHAAEIGFDVVGTTLTGYTPETQGKKLPDLKMIERLAQDCPVPVIAEGGIHYPSELAAVFEAGAWAAVVGGAITRPLEITQRFIEALPGSNY